MYSVYGPWPGGGDGGGAAHGFSYTGDFRWGDWTSKITIYGGHVILFKLGTLRKIYDEGLEVLLG